MIRPRYLRAILTDWQNMLAFSIVGAFILVAIAAPILSPQEDPNNPTAYKVYKDTYSINRPQPPAPGKPLGTMPGQIDVYHALVWGTRTALRFGLTIAISAAVIGTLIGATSAYLGGRLNELVMRLTDAFLTIPTIAGVVLFNLLLYPQIDSPALKSIQELLSELNLEPITATLILLTWMPYARLVNASMFTQMQSEYVMAAKSIGASDMRIVLRHLLPNVVSPAIVLAARDVGGMVILESAFTFIGLGGVNEWGVLVVDARNWIYGLDYWWVFIPATVTLILFGVGWNLLGDRLNVILNPRAPVRRF